MKFKIRDWSKRYIPAEISAIVFALAFSFLFTNNQILSAYVATIGESIGYYGFIIIRDIKLSKSNILKKLRNLLVEFGPAEILDSLFVRPLSFFIFPIILKNHTVGIILGKIFADIIFYIPTIFFYEFRKKYLK